MILFKYSVLRCLVTMLMLLPLAMVSYGFIREALPVDDFLYSILCIVVAISFIVFGIHILNEVWVKVTADKEGISVKRLYNSFSTEWEDIIEFGREQPFGYGAGIWKYYLIVNKHRNRKLKVCHGRLANLKKLNAYIITKVEASKLKNISQGMSAD